MRKKNESEKLWQQVRKYLAIIFLGLIGVFCYMPVMSQNLTVSGSVGNIEGEAIPGATVVVKGTTIGTTTDADGNYMLGNVPRDAVLVFSFVGMKNQEIPVAGKINISVVMEQEVIGIEEVVAVGYGTVKKADLTGSVATIQGEELISKKSTVKITNALQGTMPGVSVTRSNGEPGTSGSVRVRGITTIGDSNPLVIVDGIPGSLDDLNPEDIESISVLKDAASASIFGSKAAAGVIVVRTRRGKPGQMELKYDVQYGWDQPTRIPENTGAVTYMKMVNELIWNDNGNTGTEFPRYSKELIEDYPSLHAENPNLYPDTDWSQYIKNFSPRQNHTVSFTAGEEKFSTRGSVSYDMVESVIDDRPYENFIARVNNDVRINKVLTAYLDIQYIYSHDQRKQSTPSPTLFNGEPTERAYWTDGRVAVYRNGENAFARLLDGGDDTRWNNEISGRLGMDIKPVEGLKLSGVFAPHFTFYKRKDHSLALPMTSWNNPTEIVGYVYGIKKTSLSEYRNDSKSFTSQFLADYTKSFDDHSLTLLAGYEYYYSFSEALSASRDQYELDDYPYLNLGPLDYRDNSGSASEYASRSYFGRVMYNYKSKYLLQANARYDGSSRFDKDYRFGLFPSVSLGWVISEEAFMKNISAISFLKLRASYGTLGNERIGNYPYQSTVAFNYALMSSGTDVSSTQTAYIPRYAIKDISWETTKTWDIGLDANFFDNKLQFVVDYYRKNTSDMLLALEIPDYIGLDNPNQNTGKMETKGWELEVRYRNSLGDLNYSISANISDSKSIMGDLGGTEFLGDQVKYKGSEFNEWYGYKSDGIYQTQEEVDNSATINNRVKPGDLRYIDISGPDGVPDGKISAEYDKTLLGGSLPRYEYGGNIRLDYKNFDFSLIFQGVGKRLSYLNVNIVQPVRGGILAVPTFIADNYWSHYNTDEQNRKAEYPRLSEVAAGSQNRNNGHQYVTSDYWLIDGSYFRLKNIILGYTFP
ncbi:SusC/RagA family TonB-linked outer membrane protein, partial [Mariniphaga sediminis]|uniref:SusC/RagA family TonB-linked outer membrane protein n=1 Tax=Mariniphaga sediminis TaxID=1628158 RepID=UPI0035667ED1